MCYITVSWESCWKMKGQEDQGVRFVEANTGCARGRRPAPCPQLSQQAALESAPLGMASRRKVNVFQTFKVREQLKVKSLFGFSPCLSPLSINMLVILS